jgi:hypothetical protein
MEVTMFKHGCVALLLISASACGGRNSTTPTGPSAPSATVQTVTLTPQYYPPPSNGAFLYAWVGATNQLTLVEGLSNSTTRVVPADQLVWTSSNASVATVSPAGLVTVKSFGSVTISTVYQGVTRSIDFYIVDCGC